MTYSNPAAYDRFMGRWSARLAPSFLSFAGVRNGQHLLDVGCGTGSLGRMAVSFGHEIRVTGIDPVPAFLSFAREAVPDPRVQFQIGAAEKLSFPDGRFDAALALLVLQDFANPGQAVGEMARVTREGGIVAACLWDFRDGLPMLSLFWRTAETIAPEAVARQRTQSSPQADMTLDDLQRLWKDSGLSDISTTTLHLAMTFTSFDDYWQPFLGGSTPTSAFAAKLNAQTGGALAQALRDKLAGEELDGSFVLPARAWAVKGTVRRQTG